MKFPKAGSVSTSRSSASGIWESSWPRRNSKLDLAHANVDLPQGKIILRGVNGIERTIPVDPKGYFYINWQLTATSPHLMRAPIENVLKEDKLRLLGETNGLRDDFNGKLVVVGSAAQGNDLTDRGATPLERDTLLVSKHWNVANSIITGQFIRRMSLPAELALIILLGVVTAFLTWQLRAFSASGGTLLLTFVYIGIAFFVFIKFRFWLPIIFPVVGAILIEHIMLVTYRVVFEVEREQRRVRSIFFKNRFAERGERTASSKKTFPRRRAPRGDRVLR